MKRRDLPLFVVTLVGVGLLAITTGCIGFTSQLLWTLKGNVQKAQYEGLEGKRVAVVAMSTAAFYDPSDPTGEIAQRVSDLIAANVKDVELVEQDMIADWIDQSDWQANYRQIGIGVKADRVVAIDFTKLSFRDSSTLVKGRAEFTVSVFDIHSGNLVFRKQTLEHEFPKNSPADISSKKFAALYKDILAAKIARYFYDYPKDELFATEAGLP